jgi:hypothetical protein
MRGNKPLFVVYVTDRSYLRITEQKFISLPIDVSTHRIQLHYPQNVTSLTSLQASQYFCNH